MPADRIFEALSGRLDWLLPCAKTTFVLRHCAGVGNTPADRSFDALSDHLD